MSKVVLITGASSGIGRASAFALSKAGYKLVLTGRNKERLLETYAQLSGDGHTYLQADLNLDQSMNDLVEMMPTLVGIVHASGIIKIVPLKFINRRDFSELMETNLFAPFFLTQKLLKKKKIADGASLVFIASISGPIIGAKGNLMYSATKSALNGMVKTLALELADKRIRANTICAGMVKTEMWTTGETAITPEQFVIDELKYPLGYGKPEDVAAQVLNLIEPGSKWITGASIIIDGGFTIQ